MIPGVAIYGAEMPSNVSFVFISSRDTPEARKKAERLAKALKIRAYAFISLSQPLYTSVLNKINPKLVIPLDEEAYERFTKHAEASQGSLKFVRLSGYRYVAVAPPGLDVNALAFLIAKIGSLSKFFINYRARFFAELEKKRKNLKRKSVS